MEFWRMPLDGAEHEMIIGKVNIIAYRCKGCSYCIEFCPNDVLAESPDFNEKGYHPPYVKVEGKCVSCNFCETVCPEFALYITEQGRKKLAPEDVIPGAAEGTRRRRRRSEK
jgi:2-oxoglutarate ferredoxin oxidoreductase subunit delta